LTYHSILEIIKTNMQTSLDKKVSVVIPCYKYAHYLKECVDSIKNQTYPVHEIIVVNDGSPDNTSEVARELGVILVEKVNGGLSSARNAGIKVATGDWIMCLDADDKLVPGAIEEHVSLLQDEKTIAQCALMEFDERHVVMTPMKPTSLERILRGNTIYCNAMFHKSVWEAIGGFDESDTMRWGWEDYEFWIRCLEYGCHVNTSDFIALRYRCHEGQMTQATTHPHWDDLKKYLRTKHKHLYEKYNIDGIYED
jgi:glycosyltransferase involved in cell wall biosynthesis